MSDQMVILVGARGYIGSKILSVASSQFRVFGTSTKPHEGFLEFNLARPLDFDFSLIKKGTTVVLTAAISSPDKCSSQFDTVWGINVEGTALFIEKILKRAGRVMFFSSDTVYGEQSELFDETIEAKPLGPYAKMKAAVEDRFRKHPNFKSLRLSYVFSREDKFTTYLINCAKNGQEAEVFHPFFRSVIHLDDVVSGVLALVRTWNSVEESFINFGGPEVLSRLDFTKVLSESSLPTLKYRIYEPKEDFFANRPKVIKMRSLILSNLLGRAPRQLSKAVELEFAQEIHD